MAEEKARATDRFRRWRELNSQRRELIRERWSEFQTLPPDEQARIDIDPVVVGRRPGDPAAVVASADKISRELDWRAVHDLTSMVNDVVAPALAR